MNTHMYMKHAVNLQIFYITYDILEKYVNHNYKSF
jgi:hypothetical protein